jgi:hypothetical protein
MDQPPFNGLANPRDYACRITISSRAIDMSKPSLQLIHCSNGILPGAKRRQNGRSFRPLIIDGGVRSAAGAHSWQAALELFDLGLVVFYRNYLALLEANMAVLDGCKWTDPGKAG